MVQNVEDMLQYQILSLKNKRKKLHFFMLNMILNKHNLLQLF